MVPSIAAARCLQRAHIVRTLPGSTAALSAFLSMVTLNFAHDDIIGVTAEGPEHGSKNHT